MVMLALRAFAAAKIVALFYEPSDEGDIHDIDAPRNAPAKHPEDHLALILYHSALDYLEIAAADEITVSHGSVAAGGAVGGNVSQSAIVAWAAAVADRLLLDISSLGLTDPPLVLVATSDGAVISAAPVQVESAGRQRFVRAYSTASEVRLAEWATRSGSALSAIDITYKVLVLVDPPARTSGKAWDFDHASGATILDGGRWRSDRAYLQRSPGASLAMIKGRSADARNGTIRVLKADNSTFEPMPPGATVTITPGTGATASLAYTGSFAGGDAIAVDEPRDTEGIGPLVKGFLFSPSAKTMTFADGDRALKIPDGRMFGFLPQTIDLDDEDLSYGDPSKARMSTHLWRIHRYTAAVDGYETGRSFVTARPGETDTIVELADVPEDATLAMALVRVERTVAPTHNWMGSPITALVPQGKWMTIAGGASFHLKSHLCLARLLHFYIDDDVESPHFRKFVAHLQQSITASPAGYGSYGQSYAAFTRPDQFDVNGGETLHNGNAGWPVYYPGDTGSPHYKSRLAPDSEIYDVDWGIYYPATLYRQSGGDPPSISDPTSYASTWRVDLRGLRFGRSF